VIGELFARFYLGLGDPPLSIEDEKVEYRFKPGIYHRFGNTITINLFSMRSGPITPEKVDPRELRVLMVGDSVINGGSLTDDRELATAILQDQLSSTLQRPVYVANISAGSWGPPNQAAYLRKFGWFDADLLVLVLSSHDAIDTPSFEPTVGVHPSYPDHKPLFALTELIQRYSPLSGFFNPVPIQSFELQYSSPSDEVLEVRKEKCQQALREMLEQAQKQGIPCLILIHSTRDELDGQIRPERSAILEVASEKAVPVLEDGPAMKDSLLSGKDPLRDNDEIHPNAIGQQILASILYDPILNQLRSRIE
jgi:lysophospholipase L1-like esterase